jgi:isopentenyl phosphate kinase
MGQQEEASELVFVKFGGSLITDKRQRYYVRADLVRRLGSEIQRARAARPGLRLLLGHGSGSFGHVAARESGYEPSSGFQSAEAYVHVAAAASALNNLVRASLLEVGLPILSLAPSASAFLRDGEVADMAIAPFKELLKLGALPLTYGDVALYAGESRGGIASTEAVFSCLARGLRPQRLILLGNVDGVFASPPGDAELKPPLLQVITPDNWEAVRAGLGGSHGTDVTGGMVTKVEQALALVQAVSGLHVHIVNGEQEGLLEALLIEPSLAPGTRIHAGDE